MQEDEQIVQETEEALAAKGLTGDLDEAETLLRRRKDAKERLQTTRANQFGPDAFQLQAQLSTVSAESDQLILIARFLRKFAEHSAKHALRLKDTHNKPKDIVDNMPAFTEENN